MQDRTINNALLALHRAGGTQGKLAEVLMDIRGVRTPSYYQNQPLKRGEAQRIVLDALKNGPMTNKQLGKVIRQARPDITHRVAANRSYQALLRLKDRELVVQDFGPDGCMWRSTIR